MLCYVMLCYVMLCYVMLCYVMLCYVMLCHMLHLFNSSFNHWQHIQHCSTNPSSPDECNAFKIHSITFDGDGSGHIMAWTLSSEMIARENAEKDENSVWKEGSMYPWWELRICSFGPESVKRNGTFWVPSKIKVQSTPSMTTPWVFVQHLSFSLRTVASAPQWGQPMCTKTHGEA